MSLFQKERFAYSSISENSVYNFGNIHWFSANCEATNTSCRKEYTMYNQQAEKLHLPIPSWIGPGRETVYNWQQLKATKSQREPEKGDMKNQNYHPFFYCFWKIEYDDSGWTQDTSWCWEVCPEVLCIVWMAGTKPENLYHGNLKDSCRLRGMPSDSKPSSSPCLAIRMDIDIDEPDFVMW